eukprot:886682-Rhodomonas_salina.3
MDKGTEGQRDKGAKSDGNQGGFLCMDVCDTDVRFAGTRLLQPLAEGYCLTSIPVPANKLAQRCPQLT